MSPARSPQWPDGGRVRLASGGPEPVPFADRSFLADPYPTYAWLRAQAPVCWFQQAGAWVITGHCEVRSVLRDPISFSSAPHSRIGDSCDPYDDISTGMVIITDPPQHRPARRIFLRDGAYRAAATERQRGNIARVCQEVIRRLPQGEIDAVADVVLPAVSALAQDFFALPEPKHGEPRWQDFLVGYYHPGTGAVTDDLVRYLERVVTSGRENPGSDPISLAVLANDREQLLTDRQIAWNFYDAILAGAASTLAVAAESIAVLAQRPQTQQARYWDTVESAKRSAEELLRWVSHIHAVTRTATRNVTLGDQQIHSGEVIRAAIASANRDEAVWERGEELDLARESDHPIFAFGYGPHIATGARLARVFLSTFLPIFISSRRPFHLSGKAEHARTRTISTPLRIPVTSDPV
jgi:cytochrome P450